MISVSSSLFLVDNPGTSGRFAQMQSYEKRVYSPRWMLPVFPSVNGMLEMMNWAHRSVSRLILLVRFCFRDFGLPLDCAEIKICSTQEWNGHSAVCVLYARITDQLTKRYCRERDTLSQRIGTVDEVISAVIELVEGTLSWNDACLKLPEYSGKQDVAE